jgi:CBS domain containing-hemolysin-like protein
LDSSSWVMFASIVVLILLSAFFSASETAFSTVNKIRLRNYVDGGSTKAQRALEIAEDYDNVLSTILIGNNVVNIASTAIATILFTNLFGASGAAISTAVMTVLVLIFGEILPKSYAKENSEALALRFAAPLGMLMTVLKPFVWFFVKLKGMMARFTGSGDNSPSVTEQELKVIIETIEGEGVLEEQESDLVQSALEFDEIDAQEVITPRVDMIAVDIDDPIEETIKTVMESRYTRIPVYQGSTDNIIGILQARDLLESIIRGGEIDLRRLLSDPLFVHKTKKISTLLSDFKRNKVHIAVVTDDYGGTMGIVTMEDLLEELVGDIWDEDEEEVQELVQVGENRYEVTGDMNVYEMFEQLGVDDRSFDSDYNTISGWAMEMLEHIPEVGESFTYKNLTITVLEQENQRIIKLLVEVTPEEGPSEIEQDGK